MTHIDTASKDAGHSPAQREFISKCDFCEKGEATNWGASCDECFAPDCSCESAFTPNKKVIHAVNAHDALVESNTHLKGSVVKLFKGRRDARKERDRLREELKIERTHLGTTTTT